MNSSFKGLSINSTTNLDSYKPHDPNITPSTSRSGIKTPGATNGSTTPANELDFENDRIVIGVDFGTTYSGVAAAYTGSPDDIEVIKSWPGGNGITSDKVPTEFSYTRLCSPSSSPASPAQISWGFRLAPHAPRIRCIKLFLDPQHKLPSFVSPQYTASHLATHDKTVADAVADYLREILAHSTQALEKRWGERFVRDKRKRFVITVPAVWSESAKAATVKAARAAGMGGCYGNTHGSDDRKDQDELIIVSEPEAAAVFTLKNAVTGSKGGGYVNPGDEFVVVDGGGGTVDLIAYRIVGIEPLRVEESAVGTGGLCGSAFLNYRFEEHVIGRIGMQRYREIKEKKNGKTWNVGLKYFEEFVKRNFDDEEQNEINIPFPGLADDEEAGIDCGFLTMTAAQVKSIIDPIVQQVIELVEGQVDKVKEKNGHVKGIILVGGFGSSTYMYKCIKLYFNQDPPPPYSSKPTHKAINHQSDSIEVFHPIHAWTAVVRGAVLLGLEYPSLPLSHTVLSRQCRMHYGTSYATYYDESIHKLEERYYSALWERWMVADRLQWHISKDTRLSDLQPVSFNYTRNFGRKQSLIVTDVLYACAEDVPPNQVGGEGVRKVATLTTDLSVVPPELFRELTATNGSVFRNLDFDLIMFVQSAELGFELRVDDVRYSCVKAEFH